MTGGRGQAEELAQAATDITRNGKLVSTHIVWVCGHTTNRGLGLVWLGWVHWQHQLAYRREANGSSFRARSGFGYGWVLCIVSGQVEHFSSN